MNYKKAQSLLQIDPKNLSEAERQKYTVSLLDAWRHAKGDYGTENDFFVWCGELKASIPKDYWLLQNINARLNEMGL